MSASDSRAAPVAPLVALSLPVPPGLPDTLALGAFLKNTVTVVRGGMAHVSAPVGDLGDPDAIVAFEATAAALLEATGADPVVVAHDLHPDFPSTRHAATLGRPTLPVQHHHAHMGAVAAEYGLDHPFLGLALDGFGLGPGNESWGGELLWVKGPRYTRVGYLARLRQPGGDIAAREPWRMAAAALHALGRGEEISKRFAAFPAAKLLPTIIAKGLNSPETSSCGRLFDAACGLLGVKPVAAFEGEAPMALEALVRKPRVQADGWQIGADGVLSFAPLLDRLADEADAVTGAELFHGTLAAGLAEWAVRAARTLDTRTVALGGGCFFNAVLTRTLEIRLLAAGLRPLRPRTLSPGDPAVSLGQAWIAAHAAREGA